MKVASAGRRVLPRWPIDRARPLEEHQRLVLGAEGQLLGVVGVVEAERDDRADLERRQPDHLLLGDDAAVGQAQRARRRAPASPRAAPRRRRRGRASSPGRSTAAATTRVSSRPRPSISIASDAPAPTRGEPAATPASSRSPGARVMNSLMSLTRRATPRNVPPVLAACTGRPSTRTRTPSASGSAMSARAVDLRADGAGAVARLEADRRAVVGVVRQAAVGDDDVAGHEVQRLALADSGRRCGR